MRPRAFVRWRMWGLGVGISLGAAVQESDRCYGPVLVVGPFQFSLFARKEQ